MDWWIWVVVGFALLAFEMATPGGFYLFFFGAAALLVGFLTGLGLGGPAWLQGVLFAALSCLAMLVFRPLLIKKMHTRTSTSAVDTLVGERAVAQGEIPPKGMGKVELRGTRWNARNTGATAIGPNQPCRVEKADGLVLSVLGE